MHATQPKQIIFLTETPFRERDYERFGISLLSRQFEVEILDCTRLLRPQFWEKFSHLRFECPGYKSVARISDIKKFFSNCEENAIAIDYLFSGKTHDEIRMALRNHKVPRSIFLGASLPFPKQRGVARMRQTVRRARDSTFCHYSDLRLKLQPHFSLPASVADFAVLSGRKSLDNPKSRAPHQIWAHHFDYDTYLALRELPHQDEAPYALFLDQDFVNNSDRMITGTAPYVSESRYYSSLNRFFSDFEMRTGLPVKIAAHPKSEISFTSAAFSGRTTEKGDTARLTRDATIVFGHYSFALSFAILWNKPLVLLTTDELCNYYLYPYIEAYRDGLSVPLVNVDKRQSATIDLPAWLDISTNAYREFKYDHIKAPGTPEKPLWEIFSNAVNEHFS